MIIYDVMSYNQNKGGKKMRNVRIRSMEKQLPTRIVTSEEIDKKLGLPNGWTEKKSGVKQRHYVENETASDLAAQAIVKALNKADLSLDDIDAIICTSGTMEQAIPCTAALIHEKLAPNKPIPAFDINSTCLSFVTGLDVISHLIHSGTYKRAILVSSEVASVGLNDKQKESYVLFGDAAVACIIEQSDKMEASKIYASKMETYSEGAHYTEIRGGGTGLHPNFPHDPEDNLFDMNGRKIYKLSARVIQPFVSQLLETANLQMEDLKAVVPHQASGMAMRLIGKKLGIPAHKLVNVIENYGNTIAASIPLALHEAIQRGDIQRGDTIMLLGTSAGLSVGGIVLDY